MPKPIQRQARGTGRTRALVRRGTRSDRSPLVAIKEPPPGGPTLCPGCGAVYRLKTWRRSQVRRDLALSLRAEPKLCPACRQVGKGTAFGRIAVDDLKGEEQAVRQRITHVVERARFTQPEHRLVKVRRVGAGLEVLTTSQKLAHRIVRELVKAFHGRATYHWSAEDGSLFARWNPR
jgi:hypothetical protein